MRPSAGSGSRWSRARSARRTRPRSKSDATPRRTWRRKARGRASEPSRTSSPARDASADGNGARRAPLRPRRAVERQRAEEGRPALRFRDVDEPRVPHEVRQPSVEVRAGVAAIEEPDAERREPHDRVRRGTPVGDVKLDRKSTRLNSSHMSISYAVFCLKKKIDVITISHNHVICITYST